MPRYTLVLERTFACSENLRFTVRMALPILAPVLFPALLLAAAVPDLGWSISAFVLSFLLTSATCLVITGVVCLSELDSLAAISLETVEEVLDREYPGDPYPHWSHIRVCWHVLRLSPEALEVLSGITRECEDPPQLAHVRAACQLVPS